MSVEPQFKMPGENRLYAVNFGNQPEIRDAGQTLTGTPTVQSTPSGLTVGAPVINGNLVQFRLSGGTDLIDYTLTVLVSTSDGVTILGAAVVLKVRAVPAGN